MYDTFQHNATPTRKKIKKVLMRLGNTALIANFVAPLGTTALPQGEKRIRQMAAQAAITPGTDCAVGGLMLAGYWLLVILLRMNLANNQ